MSSLEIVDNQSGASLEITTEEVSLEVSSNVVEFLELPENLCGDLEVLEISSCPTEVVEVEPVEINLEVTPSDSFILEVADSTEPEILEKCLQGPPGIPGPAGSGGTPISVAVLSGEDKVVSTLPLSLYTAANYQLSVKDLVNNKERVNHLDYSFFDTSNVRCRKSGFRNSDLIPFKYSYTTDAVNFYLKVKNNTPNSLIVTGIEKPINRT